MASGTADLQRDLGGAVMQSIFGALLTASYVKAATAAVDAAPEQVAASTEAEFTKSFDGAEAVAAQYPQYADAFTSAARASFVQGDQWAYLAGILAVLLGALLVATRFPRHDDERALLASYEATDSGTEAGRT